MTENNVQIIDCNSSKFGKIGQIEIDRTNKIVHIRAVGNEQLGGRGFGGIPLIRTLGLADFIETKSGIPWNKLAPSLKGYTIKLYSVMIDDEYDIWCENWFKQIGAIIEC